MLSDLINYHLPCIYLDYKLNKERKLLTS